MLVQIFPGNFAFLGKGERIGAKGLRVIYDGRGVPLSMEPFCQWQRAEFRRLS